MTADRVLKELGQSKAKEAYAVSINYLKHEYHLQKIQSNASFIAINFFSENIEDNIKAC